MGPNHQAPRGLPAHAAAHRLGEGARRDHRSLTTWRLLPETTGGTRGQRSAMSQQAEDLIRRLGATVRAAELYASTHPQVQRTATGLLGALTPALNDAAAVIVAFLEDDVVLNDFRLPRGSAHMAGLLRDMRDRKVEKITFARGVEIGDIRALMDELADRVSRTAVGDRLTARGIRRVLVSKVAVEDEEAEPVGLAAATQMYSKAVASAETIWAATKAG